LTAVLKTGILHVKSSADSQQLQNKPEGLNVRLLITGLAICVVFLSVACIGRQSGEAEKGGTTTAMADDTGFVDYISHAYGKRYEVTVPNALLEKTPKWDGADENPPLSAKKALEAANKMKDSLVSDTKGIKWVLESLALAPSAGARWYWTATYRAACAPGYGASGPPITLTLVILMNGTAIQPKVSDG
jgi:hypothetical protein